MQAKKNAKKWVILFICKQIQLQSEYVVTWVIREKIRIFLGSNKRVMKMWYDEKTKFICGNVSSPLKGAENKQILELVWNNHDQKCWTYFLSSWLSLISVVSHRNSLNYSNNFFNTQLLRTFILWRLTCKRSNFNCPNDKQTIPMSDCIRGATRAFVPWRKYGANIGKIGIQMIKLPAIVYLWESVTNLCK